MDKSRPSKALTAKDVASLEELARNCFALRDYEQVVQIAESVPENSRTLGLTALLEKARAATDEIAFLVVEIDQAVPQGCKVRAAKGGCALEDQAGPPARSGNPEAVRRGRR